MRSIEFSTQGTHSVHVHLTLLPTSPISPPSPGISFIFSFSNVFLHVTLDLKAYRIVLTASVSEDQVSVIRLKFWYDKFYVWRAGPFSPRRGCRLSRGCETFWAKQTYFQGRFFLKRVWTMILIYASSSIIVCSFAKLILAMSILILLLLGLNIYYIEDLHHCWSMHLCFTFALCFSLILYS